MLEKIDLDRLAMLNSSRFIWSNAAPATDVPLHEALYAKLNALRDGQAAAPFTPAERSFLAGLARTHVAHHRADGEVRRTFEALADKVDAL